MSKFKVVAASLLLGISGLVNAAVVTIDFDGTGAPDTFSQTQPLTNLYSPQGVTFSGVNGSSGSILNQGGNFGFNARSGTDFFAYNTSGTGSIFDLTFSSAISSFSIWAASSVRDTYSIEAFDSNGASIDTDSLIVSSAWQELSVAGSGIARIRIDASAIDFGAFDDMTFSTDRTTRVPEPGTLMLLGVAMACLATNRRRSPRK